MAPLTLLYLISVPSEDTNCPMTEEAPLLFSAKVTSDTIMLSSRTQPQAVHTASPLAWSYSMSDPPHWEQTVMREE